jgi:hypothetical protein
MTSKPNSPLPLTLCITCFNVYKKESVFCAQSALFRCSLIKLLSCVGRHSNVPFRQVCYFTITGILNCPCAQSPCQESVWVEWSEPLRILLIPNLIILHPVWVQIPVPRPTILTRTLLDFSLALQVIAVILPQARTLPPPSTSFPVHSLLIILPFDAVQSELLTNLLHVSDPFFVMRMFAKTSEEIRSILCITVFITAFTKPTIGPYPEPDESSPHPYHISVTFYVFLVASVFLVFLWQYP